MEPNTSIEKNMDDVVFENRHKEYGAYLIRKSYSGNMNKAFMSCVMLALTVLVLSRVASLFEDTFTPPPFTEPRVTDLSNFIIEPPKPQRHYNPPPRTSPASVFPIATTSVEPPQQVIEDPSPLTSDPGTDDGTGTDPDTAGDLGIAGGESGNTSSPITPPKIIDIAEFMPHYVGGQKEMLKFFQQKTKYPARPRRQEVEGTVFVRFVVRPDSTITNVEVIKGIHPDCDAEAARVVASMPKWVPGIQDKTPVPVRMVVPIKFVLNHEGQ